MCLESRHISHLMEFKLNGVNAMLWKWRASALLFPVVPVACDQWRTRSSCFAVDACSCLLCSCPSCSCLSCSCLLCSLPTVWIFFALTCCRFDMATPLRPASAPTVSSSTTPEPSSGELRVRMSSPLWRRARWWHRARSSGDP